MKNTNTLNHRVGVRLNDGQYYTLKNFADFYNLTVADYIKKCCGIADISEQVEYKLFPVDGKVETIDITPDGVKEGRVTLKEWHDTNSYSRLYSMYEDLEEKVNILFNKQYCNPNENYVDEESGRIMKGNAGLPAKADELCYADCIKAIAYNYKQFGVTPQNLMNYIKNKMVPDIPNDEQVEG